MNYSERLFNDEWYFILKDDIEFSDQAYNHTAWEMVKLPHDWQVAGKYDKYTPTGFSGGYQHTGIGWYRKEFKGSECFGKKTILDFDGIYKDATIYLNGVEISRHYYGYTDFCIDITSYIKDTNILAVRVDNSTQPDSRWYCGSGIYRNVRLINTSDIYIVRDSLQVMSVLKDGEAEISINACICNESGKPYHGSVYVDIDGERIDCSLNLDSGMKKDVNIKHQIKAPRIWSSTDPQMYDLQVYIGDIKERGTRFGIRSIEFDCDNGFLLNGNRVQLNGACLHHDGGCVGAAVPIEVWVRRLNTLKKAGVNSIRISHNPPMREFLDLCDDMGILVMNEIFDEWRLSKNKSNNSNYGYAHHYDGNYKSDIEAMLMRDRNHPSIIMWSVGNEIPEQVGQIIKDENLISEYYDAAVSREIDGVKILKELIDICRRLDPTRPITSACDLINAEPRAADLRFLNALDIVGYNYPDRWRMRRETSYEEDRINHPDWCMVGAEITSVGMVRGNYSVKVGDTTGHKKSYSEAMLDVERLMKYVNTHPHIAGDYMWAGIDYLGESHWPEKNTSCGILDTAGFIKDSYYFYQSQWTNDVVLHIMPHWNMKGKEGEIIPVVCYTNCEYVELLLNGKSYGKKAYEFPRQGMTEQYGHYDRPVVGITTNDLHLVWDVPYEPGILEVIGYNGGREAKRCTVRTTGDPYSVIIEADEGLIENQKVYHITAKVVDREGSTVPTAENTIQFFVEGGNILGVDNGNPASHESFASNVRKTFAGYCLAIVEKTENVMKVKAVSNHLKSSNLTVSDI